MTAELAREMRGRLQPLWDRKQNSSRVKELYISDRSGLT